MIKWFLGILVAIIGGLSAAYALSSGAGLNLSPLGSVPLLPVRSVSTESVVMLEPVKIVLVGDMMLDRGVELSVTKSVGGDFNWLFANTSELAKADILFGNLEGPVSDLGYNVGSIYSFRMETGVVSALVAAGFDVLSLANNHIGDWTLVAALDTKQRLAESGIKSVGLGDNKLDAATPVIFDKSGQKIGWLAFSDVGPDWLAANETSAGIIIAADESLPQIINTASQAVDHLVVSFHFGNEYETRSSIRQQELAHLAIDHGARLVVGHHPHVVQEVERYKTGLIAYSLGNFIFDQSFSPETMRGLVLEVELDKTGIKSARTRVSQLDQYFRPTLSNITTDV